MEGERGRMEWNGGLREEGEEGEEREETALPDQPPTAVPGLRLRVTEGGEGRGGNKRCASGRSAIAIGLHCTALSGSVIHRG